MNPPTGTPDALRLKQAPAGKARVDYGLYGLLAEDNLEHLDALAAGGVAAFKCFMGNTFGNLPSPSTGAMLEVFEIIARHGLRISLHAETASIMAWRQRKLVAAGRHDPLAHLASRPAVVATEAVSRAAVLAEWTGARIHMHHHRPRLPRRGQQGAQARPGGDHAGQRIAVAGSRAVRVAEIVLHVDQLDGGVGRVQAAAQVRHQSRLGLGVPAPGAGRCRLPHREGGIRRDLRPKPCGTTAGW